jgi:hypothetical protein
LGLWAEPVRLDRPDLEESPAQSDLLDLRLNHPMLRLGQWDPLVLRAHRDPKATLDRLVLLAQVQCFA